MSELKVGDKIWRFDENRRRYPPPLPGNKWSHSAPIYREHWREIEITGETRISWITPWGKCPKRGGRGWALTAAEVDNDVWDHDNRRAIACLIESRHKVSTTTLREVAKLIGHEA